MQLLELTLPTAAENVALDEALLDEAEERSRGSELLRLWELPKPAVVIGRSSRLDQEVEVSECRRQGLEIVRRSSGGAAIVAGPGCLMYSLLLSYDLRPALRSLDHAHQFVLERLSESLAKHAAGVQCRGISDLAIGGRKVSGNSLRCKRNWCLYHGTLLYAFDLSCIPWLLKTPPRQPTYRAGRPHEEFVANLPLPGPTLVRSVIGAFGADKPTTVWPHEEVQRLVRERYGREEWTRER